MLVRWGAHAAELAEAPRYTSMCMEIAGFDHDDCPAPPWCACACHKP
jgi:hypothetical protein